MRTLMAAVLAASAVGLAVAADPNDPTAGKWVVESVTRDGAKDDGLAGATRVHEGGKYTVTPAAGKSGAAVSGTYTVDAGKSPVTIDMKPAAGRYKDQTLLGIVKADGDHLTVCFAEPGKERPTKFESGPGSGLVLAIHKKAK